MKPPLPGALPRPFRGGRMSGCVCIYVQCGTASRGPRHRVMIRGTRSFQGVCLWMKRNYTPSGIELSTGIICETGQTHDVIPRLIRSFLSVSPSI